MSAILEAARIQGSQQIGRKAWVSRGSMKVHLWELSEGGVILLRHDQGKGFIQPVLLDEPLEVVVDRFRNKVGNRVFSPNGA